MFSTFRARFTIVASQSLVVLVGRLAIRLRIALSKISVFVVVRLIIRRGSAPMRGMSLRLLPLLALMLLPHLVHSLQLHLTRILLLHLVNTLLHLLLALVCTLVPLRKLPRVSPLMFRLFPPRSRRRLSSPLLPLRRTLWLLAFLWLRIRRSRVPACLLWRIFRLGLTPPLRLVPLTRRVFWFTVLLSLIPSSRTRVFCLLMPLHMPLALV